MTVRAVEGKKPYTGGVAIEVTEDKVINLRLRDENNLIIWDEGDNEIYVDLQLGDEITPTDTFPVGITTGRAIVDNGWDATGTLVCFKTTSGDNIKLFYTDSGSVFVDNGTGTFKQIYLKSEVDALLATKQNLLTAGDNITIDSNNVISSDKGIVVSNTQPSDATEGLLWYNTVTDQLKVYDGTDWNGIGGGGGGSTYTAGHGINIDANDEISNTLPFEPTNTGTAGQVLKLDSNGNYGWDNESGGGSDIEYVTSAEYNALLPGAASDGKHYFIYSTGGGTTEHVLLSLGGSTNEFSSLYLNGPICLTNASTYWQGNVTQTDSAGTYYIGFDNKKIVGFEVVGDCANIDYDSFLFFLSPDTTFNGTDFSHYLSFIVSSSEYGGNPTGRVAIYEQATLNTCLFTQNKNNSTTKVTITGTLTNGVWSIRFQTEAGEVWNTIITPDSINEDLYYVGFKVVRWYTGQASNFFSAKVITEN